MTKDSTDPNDPGLDLVIPRLPAKRATAPAWPAVDPNTPGLDGRISRQPEFGELATVPPAPDYNVPGVATNMELLPVFLAPGGPDPDPEPEPEIILSSIDARGMSGVAAEPMTGPAVLATPLAIPIQRQGFDEAGAPTMHNDIVYVTARRRKPYPDSTQNSISLTDKGVVFNENVCAGDVIPGVINNSALKWPRGTASWTRMDYQFVDDKLPIGLALNNFSDRNGTLAACVKFHVTDGETTLEATVTRPRPFMQELTGYCLIEWFYEFDTSVFPDGATLSVRAVVYPWYGDETAVFDSANYTNNWETRNQTYYKHSGVTAAPVCMYVDAQNGDNNTGIASTDPKVARANPFASFTFTKAIAANNAAYGYNDTDGIRVRLMTDVTRGDGGFPLRRAVMEKDELTYPGPEDRPTFTYSGTVSMGSVMTSRGIAYVRESAAILSGLWYFENCTFLMGTTTSGSRFGGGNGAGTGMFWRKCRVLLQAGYNANFFAPGGAAGSRGGLVRWQDVIMEDGSENIPALHLLGVKFERNVILRGFATSYGTPHDVHVEAVVQMNQRGTSGRNYEGSGYGTNPILELNYLVEEASGVERNFIGIAGGSSPTSVYGYHGRYRMVAGWDMAARENNFYDDHSTIATTHPWARITHSIISRTATKGDRFVGVLDGERLGAMWWEYQVGGRNNIIIWPLQFPLIYYGKDSRNNVASQMRYADNQASTAENVAGSGYGNYHLRPDSVGAAMDISPAVGWDIEGNPRMVGGPIGVYGTLAA
ncbi:MAG: hypothetical protein WCZ66_09090 [Sphingomonadaceae bacterium]